MKLFIHIGLYKAGSSYLQYVCSYNREYLKTLGIYFPFSKEDKKMLAGEISKGNADGLEKVLKNKKPFDIEKLLNKWKTETEQNGCHSLVLSAEALVHQVADQDILTLLAQSAKNVGFHETSILCFFRDWVDHALSTFKHRGKTGRILDFGMWLENSYETPDLIDRLIQTRNDRKDVHWVFRKFYKDGQKLNQTFFNEWLGIPDFNFEGRSSVNESVTLSEVVLLQYLNRYYFEVINSFVDSLKSIPKSMKGDDAVLEEQYTLIAYNSLLEKHSILDNLNSLIEDKGKVLLTSKEIVSDLSARSEMVFSEEQIKAVLQTIDRFNKPLGRFSRLKTRLIRLIPRSYRLAILKKD